MDVVFVAESGLQRCISDGITLETVTNNNCVCVLRYKCFILLTWHMLQYCSTIVHQSVFLQRVHWAGRRHWCIHTVWMLATVTHSPAAITETLWSAFYQDFHSSAQFTWTYMWVFRSWYFLFLLRSKTDKTFVSCVFRRKFHYISVNLWTEVCALEKQVIVEYSVN